MKMVRIMKESIDGSYLYHATYRPLIPSIKRSGLGSNVDVKAWEDSKDGVVYFAIDPDIAYSYAETSELVPEEWLDNIVILEVGLNVLDIEKIYKDENNLGNHGTVEYHGIVQWDQIEVLG